MLPPSLRELHLYCCPKSSYKRIYILALNRNKSALENLTNIVHVFCLILYTGISYPLRPRDAPRLYVGGDPLLLLASSSLNWTRVDKFSPFWLSQQKSPCLRLSPLRQHTLILKTVLGAVLESSGTEGVGRSREAKMKRMKTNSYCLLSPRL